MSNADIPSTGVTAEDLTTDAVGTDETFNALQRAVQRRIGAGWALQGQAESALRAIDQERKSGSLAELLPSAWRFRFGLTALDASILRVAAAAELSANVHLLAGLLSGDAGPARPTIALALEISGLFAADPAGRARFNGVGPLRRFGLIELEGTDALPVQRIRVPERVAAALNGDPMPPVDLIPMLLTPVPAQVGHIDFITAALGSGEPLVWVHGAPGSAGAAMAVAACQRLGVSVLVADLHRHPTMLGRADGGDTAGTGGRRAAEQDQLGDTVRALTLEAGVTGSVLVISGVELMVSSLDLLARSPLPVIAVSTERWNPLWGNELPVCVPAPSLTVQDREQLWWPLLGGAPAPREVSSLRLTPENIERVGLHARKMARLAKDEDLTRGTIDRIRSSARHLGRGRADRFGNAGAASLSDLVLPEHVTTEVERLLDWAKYRDEVLAQGPLQGKGGKGGGICALFSGGPGTGKTLAAHVVADTLGMDLMQIDLTSIVSKYIGETEKNLEKVFTEAESLNSVLFFDEADSLFGSRSEVKDSRDRYANQEVAYLLQRMEQFHGITVLATNLRGNLDPAFARRLHFVIAFPDPDADTRRRLWNHHIDSFAATDPIDPIRTGELATDLELAGGDIRNIVLSAAYAATAAHEMVGMRHISAAVSREFTKLGRRVPPGRWRE